MQALNPSQQKLAEKLIILNDRAVGMLTRLYNIKRVPTLPSSAIELIYDYLLHL